MHVAFLELGVTLDLLEPSNSCDNGQHSRMSACTAQSNCRNSSALVLAPGGVHVQLWELLLPPSFPSLWLGATAEGWHAAQLVAWPPLWSPWGWGRQMSQAPFMSLSRASRAHPSLVLSAVLTAVQPPYPAPSHPVLPSSMARLPC